MNTVIAKGAIPTLFVPAVRERDLEGIVQYALSDVQYIAKGWTRLPVEKIIRKTNIYRMTFVEPKNWFIRNKYKRVVLYKTGETLGLINDDNSGGKWLYKNGKVALEYRKAKDLESGDSHSRFVVYSRGDADHLRKLQPVTILASFDDQGNGIVYDHVGKPRLKYNQSEGVLLDKTLGPQTHWIWHSLNEPPELQKVMIETSPPVKDPDIVKLQKGLPKLLKISKTPAKDEEMLAIEFENFIKHKKKISKPYIPFKIKSKVIKINENFSLRLYEQAAIYLSFRDGNTNLRINLGMKLDNSEIIDVRTAELGDIMNPLDNFPSTESVDALHLQLLDIKDKERARVNRERVIKPKIVSCSVDKFDPFLSRPLWGRTKSRSTTCLNSRCNCLQKNFG